MASDEILSTESSGSDFGDNRLNSRYLQMLQGFFSSPDCSVNNSFDNWSEVKAAYRFLDNDKVSVDKILSSHTSASKLGASRESVVLLIQDTSIFDYSHRSDVSGLGKLRYDKDPGILIHPTIGVNKDGVCLGVFHYYSWVRETLQGKSARQKPKPVEQSESQRWIDSYKMSLLMSQELPNTTFINVADRECDFFEFITQETSNNMHWLVRSRINRRVHNQDTKIREEVSQQQAIATISFNLPAINNRRSRTVTQELKAKSVVISPPEKRKKTNNLKPISVNIISCTEVNCPEDEQPVEWFLLTSLPIDKVQDITDIIDYYRLRWQLELFFKTLKSGCNTEKLQLQNAQRIENCIAMYMIVAWRINFATMIARKLPRISCEVVYSKDEWQAIYIVVKKT